MQLEAGGDVIPIPTGGDVIPLPDVSPGQVHAGELAKFKFHCSKGHRLAYLFNFCVKFSAV